MAEEEGTVAVEEVGLRRGGGLVGVAGGRELQLAAGRDDVRAQLEVGVGDETQVVAWVGRGVRMRDYLGRMRAESCPRMGYSCRLINIMPINGDPPSLMGNTGGRGQGGGRGKGLTVL